MQVIQLYIEGQRVDMFEDESVNITETIQNIKDIGKVFGDFSQTFTIPASRNNNKIFKHYYNNSIDDGFDGRKKVDASIKLNDIDYKVGKIKLEGVDLRNNAPHAYRITFFGGIVNLKDLLGEDKINELTWLSNFNMDYNKADIIDAFRNGVDYTVDSVSYPKALVVPLITPQQRLYYDSSDNAAGTGNLYAGDSVAHGVEWTQLKPSIRIYNIIKAIEKKYNIAGGYPSDIVFSEDFFNSTNQRFYELYMWMHRKEGTVFDNLDGLYARNLDVLPIDTLNGFYSNGDDFAIYDVFSYGAAYYDTTLNVTTSSGSDFNIILLKSGSEVFRQNNNTGSTSYAFDFGELTNGFYEIRVESEAAVTLGGNLTTVRYDALKNTSPVTKVFNFTSSFALLANYVFEVTNQMPDMKVIDFLSGLFKMFNLTAYEEDGVIVVRHLDEYYSSGIEYDISKYVDITESSVDSSRLYKEISFGYQGLGSLQTKKHKELFSYDWGTEEFRGDTSYDGEIYKVQLPFEHLKYERLVNLNTDTNTSLQWGWMVSDLNQTNAYENGSVYLGKPLVFYPVLDEIGDSMRITDNGTYSDTQRYHLPSNSLTLSDSFNINFKAELNEFTNTIFEDTLFQRYYSNYISSIFDFKNRLTKITAYLPLRILSKYKLSDKFRINNKKYLINSVSTDFLTGQSKIELLSDYQTGYAPSVPARLATVTTSAATSVEETSATLNGAVTDSGNPLYTQRGFYWKLGSGDPTSADNTIAVGGTGVNSFSGSLSGLTDNTLYSFRAFAINSEGTAYGNTITLTTDEAVPLSAPTVDTSGSAGVGETYATLIGNVTNVGNPAYTSKGFYWKLGTGTPTASDNIAYGSGSAGGSYSVNLTGLSNNNTYSFRAWVSNGVDTIDLGAVLTLDTATPVVEYAPSVVTTGYSESTNSATLYGDITDVGNPNYTTKGFYWVQGSGTPTASDNIAYSSGTSAGTYLASISGLTTDTVYSFRAFATNTVLTSIGGVLSFTTQEPVTCSGGTLYFQGGTITGVNATLSTGTITYNTGECSSPIPTTSFNLFNNETGEWTSTAQVTSIQLYEGSNGGPYSTNVTGDYTINKTLSGGVISISVTGTFPDANDDGDKYLYFQITAVALDTYQTTINLPSTNAVDHASVNVTANTSASFPASRDGVTGNTQCVPVGEDGDAFEYTVTYTADAGYEFTGIGNIQPAPTTDNANVSVSVDSYTSSTITITISGNIQAANETANLNWGGTAIADPATSFTALYRIGTSGSFLPIPAGGIDVGSGGIIVQVQITPDGSYYVQLANTIVTASVTPTDAYGGDVTVHNVTINTFSGGEGNQSSLMRVYPRASLTSIGNVRFNYFDSI